MRARHLSTITVRKIRFSFDDVVTLDATDEQLGTLLPVLGLSLTMPYLEPYLIRTMNAALREITDSQLAEDVRHFAQQEAHHYRNHALFNETVRARFDDATAARLRAIEAELEDDYQRFTRTKSLRFNVVYAEGFEAMTCAGALAGAAHGAFEPGSDVPGGELWAWHMAEEIEHRTVAFGVFEHLVGSYPYRILGSVRSQWHYLSYVDRLAKEMARALGCSPARPHTPMHRETLRRYLRTFSPWYDPSKIDLPPCVPALLARYTAMAEQVRGAASPAT